MTATRLRPMTVIVALLVLLVAACGGDDSDASDDTITTSTGADTEASTSAAASDTSATTAPPESDDTAGESESGGGDLSLVPAGETDIVGNPAGQGFVELDGTRYDFVLNGACQKIFGAVQVAGTSPSDSDVGVGAIIPPEDWETDAAAGWDPPYVEIGVGDDSWRAEIGAEHFIGGETVVLTPEQSAVTAFTNDGSRVTGTANFFSEFNFDEVESQSGSFDFYCP